LISFDLVELHPLALEDVFHGHSQNRSKVDYYTKHLFLRVLCHELADDASQNGTTDHTQITNTVRSASPEPMGNNIEPEESDQMKDYDKLTQNAGPPNSGSLNKRRKLGSHPLLPTSRIDVKPIYRGTQEKTGAHLAKLISTERAVGIIHLCIFFLPLIYILFFQSQAARKEHKQDVAEIRALKKVPFNHS
jgi:hypothetical protein